MNIDITLEKYKITVPEQIAVILRRDAELFELFERGQIVMNQLLSGILVGYHAQFSEQRANCAQQIDKLLQPYFQMLNQPKKKKQLTEELLNEVSRYEMSELRRGNSVVLSLKTTIATKDIIQSIFSSLRPSESFSQYIRQMIAHYCSKPLYERERIIFRNLSDTLANVCVSRKEILFSTSTNPDALHRFSPYSLTWGPDGMFNYLLGAEYNEQKQKYDIKSYRLCRIRNVRLSGSAGAVSAEQTRLMDLMIANGPQYLITKETESRIRLKERGRDTFRMMYFGRPTPVRKDPPSEDGSQVIYFNCSEDQLYRYFRRFSPGEAEVIHPESLRNSLIRFHQESLIALGASSKD